MRTTKTEMKTCYSQKEVEQIMDSEGALHSPFPTLPVEIQFSNGKLIKIRETSVLGVDDEADMNERQFVVSVVRSCVE